MPLERRRALQRQHGRERRVLVAPEAAAVSLTGSVAYSHGLGSNHDFCHW